MWRHPVAALCFCRRDLPETVDRRCLALPPPRLQWRCLPGGVPCWGSGLHLSCCTTCLGGQRGRPVGCRGYGQAHQLIHGMVCRQSVSNAWRREGALPHSAPMPAVHAALCSAGMCRRACCTASWTGGRCRRTWSAWRTHRRAVCELVNPCFTFMLFRVGGAEAHVECVEDTQARQGRCAVTTFCGIVCVWQCCFMCIVWRRHKDEAAAVHEMPS